MDSAAFRAARAKLGLTEVEFARTFGVSRRTVQNWAAKGPPDYIAELLRFALTYKVSPPSGSTSSPNNAVLLPEAVSSFAPILEAVLEAARTSGWPLDVVRAAILHWAERR
jgi:transcriptional regulator with XRE-family HTH domain